MLTGIVKGYKQLDLFPRSPAKDDKLLMAGLDKINRKWGRNTIQYGMTETGAKPWTMQQTLKSPAYTTKWQELAVVKSACL